MNIWKLAFGLTLTMSLFVYVLGCYYDKNISDDFENKRTEFRKEWENYNKKRVSEKIDLYWTLVHSCLHNPHWNEFKEKYLQELEISGFDKSSKMFDDEIYDPSLGFYRVESFIKHYYHRDSEEREKLREYKSFYIDSWHDYKSYPYELRDYKSYKENLSTDFSFIYKEDPIESALKVFISCLLIMLICKCVINIKIK